MLPKKIWKQGLLFFTPKSAHTKAKAKVWALFLRNTVIHLSATPAIKAGYFFVTALFR